MKKLYYILIIAIFTTSITNAQISSIDSTKIRSIENNLTNKILNPSPLGYQELLEATDSTKAKKRHFFSGIINYFKSSNTDKTFKKKMDIGVIGGPNYGKETGFSIGIFVPALYRTDYSDPLLQPSNVALFGNVSTTGFYLLGIRGTHLFPGRKHKIEYTGYFYSFPSGYWGLGYETANGGNMDLLPGKYLRFNSLIKASYYYSPIKNLNVGATASMDYVKGTKWDANAWKLFQTLPKGTQTEYLSIGVGVAIQWDSRDFMLNASRGQYFKIEQKFYPKFLGNKKDASFSSTEFFFSTYHKLWKGAILAFDLHGLFTYGNTPWPMYSTTGGSYRLRGYYEGQYRDRNGIDTQLELRQKVWRRIGVTGWIGAGNVFPAFKSFKFSQMLYNYGVGLRWEFKNKVNVRLDYGIGMVDGWGKRQSGFIFNINEAF